MSVQGPENVTAPDRHSHCPTFVRVTGKLDEVSGSSSQAFEASRALTESVRLPLTSPAVQQAVHGAAVVVVVVVLVQQQPVPTSTPFVPGPQSDEQNGLTSQSPHRCVIRFHVPVEPSHLQTQEEPVLVGQ